MCSSLDGSQNRAATSTDPAPQCQCQVHVAELTRALDANALQAYRHRQICAAVVEQRRLLRSADQPPCKCPCLNPSTLIKFAELRYRLLNDAPTDTNAAYKTPIAVNLPVFPYRRVAQIHAPNQI